MDIRQLRSMVAVMDYGGFSAAAAALGTVQSNVSTHLSKLEAEVGFILIDRRTGVPTEEGALVANRARRLLAELEAIKSDLSAMAGDLHGRVRIGMIGTTARWMIPLLVPRTQDAHPNIRLEISEGTSSSLQNRLNVGRVELALINRPIGASELEFHPLFDESLVLLVDKSHRLASANEISVADLANVKLVIPPKGTGFRDELDAVAATHGVKIASKAEVDGLRLIAALAMDGFGPAILPSSSIPEHQMDHLKSIAIKDLAPRRIGFARLAKSLDSAASRAVAEILTQIGSLSTTAAPSGITFLQSN
ncbi:MAG: LysR family transcriptional regulator [Acidimicrobiaceae bacterium]|nr:LysR family transcriptional regulator [Acidimicrobiaceae bacterium]